ncbi:hypothetical protein GCM10023094_32190 [Rhodococcus olei]|uniref:Uncharacterized protein n=1 Tax=Rhodococcus olei TaxID=2161675 RepID=A0ABP8P8C3_9NOCA
MAPRSTSPAPAPGHHRNAAPDHLSSCKPALHGYDLFSPGITYGPAGVPTSVDYDSDLSTSPRYSGTTPARFSDILPDETFPREMQLSVRLLPF